jgi:SAM-dependent methyltransferase
MADPGNGGALGEEPVGPGGVDEAAAEADRWVRWHQAYEDPDSPLSARLRLVQSGMRAVLDHHPPGPIRLVSICAGQGRDVIDVVAGHPRQADVRARLVELDPTLVAFARARAAAAGVGDLIEVVRGDASRAGSYAGALPADLVLICGVFGNISDEDIRATVLAMPSFCAPGGTVVWTRHRRPPDLTPSIRAWFGEAGFAEQSFVAPEPYVLCVGRHRLVGAAGSGAPASGAVGGGAVDPDLRLFDFVGNGSHPA